MIWGYVAIFLIGAGVGAFMQAWWEDYVRHTADLRSVHRHGRARQAINLRRWE